MIEYSVIKIILLLIPLIIGAIAILTKSKTMSSWMDKFSNIVIEKKEKFAEKDGVFFKYFFKPILVGLAKILELTEKQFKDEFVRNGAKIILVFYFVAAVAFITYIIMIVAIDIIFIAKEIIFLLIPLILGIIVILTKSKVISSWVDKISNIIIEKKEKFAEKDSAFFKYFFKPILWGLVKILELTEKQFKDEFVRSGVRITLILYFISAVVYIIIKVVIAAIAIAAIVIFIAFIGISILALLFLFLVPIIFNKNSTRDTNIFQDGMKAITHDKVIKSKDGDSHYSRDTNIFQDGTKAITHDKVIESNDGDSHYSRDTNILQDGTKAITHDRVIESKDSDPKYYKKK